MNRYANGKFDDVRGSMGSLHRGYLNAEGDEVEYENEDSVEPDPEDYTYEEDMEAPVVPKYRQLVRGKKLELKAQYGKAHFTTKRECKTVPTPSTCYKKVCIGSGKHKTCKQVPYPCMKNKEVCINIPTWVWGWRKKWREFKQAGGLAQLKMVAKGMAPYVPPGTPDPNAVTVNQPTTTPPVKGGGKRSAQQIDLLENTPKTIEMHDQTIVDTTAAKGNIMRSIVFTLLIGSVVGGIAFSVVKGAK